MVWSENKQNMPVEKRYDLKLFWVKDDAELANFYKVRSHNIARVRKKFKIPKFKIIIESNFVCYIHHLINTESIKSISFERIKKEFSFSIKKEIVLRIIYDNKFDLWLTDFPKGYRIPHGLKGYNIFGCRCKNCVNTATNKMIQYKIKSILSESK